MRCITEPKAPANGRLKCSGNACQVSCLADYKFPGGESALTLACMNGRWVVKSLELNDVPACERNYNSYSVEYFRSGSDFASCFSDLCFTVQEQWNLHCTRSVSMSRKLHWANVSNGEKGRVVNELPAC